MGDNPSFLFAVIFVFFESRSFCYFCSNSFVSLFYRNVVPSKVSNRKLMLDLDFCAETDFCCPPFWAVCTPEKSKNSEKFQAWSSYMYAAFINLDLSHLSNLSASKKFVFPDCSIFDRFCLLFCIRSFTVFVWISLLQKHWWLYLMSRSFGIDCIITKYVNFWLCTNPLMRTVLSLV